LDFTFKTYRTLLDALLTQGFAFQAFRDFIREICGLGHEIGYHYETMDTANAKCKMQNAKCKMQTANWELPTADC